jgi:phasin family protein
MMTKMNLASLDEMFAPVIELNKVALTYTEKLVDLNLTSARKQADLALAGWRDVLAIKDANEVKDYLTHQGEVARGVVEGYVSDAKIVAQLNQETAEEVRKVVTESVAKATKQAA